MMLDLYLSLMRESSASRFTNPVKAKSKDVRLQTVVYELLHFTARINTQYWLSDIIKMHLDKVCPLKVMLCGLLLLISATELDACLKGQPRPYCNFTYEGHLMCRSWCLKTRNLAMGGHCTPSNRCKCEKQGCAN